MFKYSREQLVELKEHQDRIREIEGDNDYPLTPELLAQLVARFWSRRKFLESMVGRTTQHIPTIDEDHFSEYFSDACGCTGPRDGEPYCNCTMGYVYYRYRYDIAIAVLDSAAVTQQVE